MTPNELTALLQSMSLDEKIGELYQLSATYLDVDAVTGPADELGLSAEDVARAGSCLSVTGAKVLHAIQQRHIARQPHHIPMLFMADIINGYKTIFPVPLGQGATFDPALVEECAAVAAREAAAAGVHVTFSPMADLVRDARWGRVMEATGEDPYLNAQLAAAMVRGYQGPDNRLTDKGRLAACVKHFAGYGAPMGGRDYNTVELSPRALREDYLPAYRAAVEAGAALVMTSFNTLDRVPSSANRWLLRDVLRREWGFDGVVISDWAAVKELIAHGVAEDDAQAAELALRAGVDIDMSTGVYARNLKALLDAGRVTQALIDEAALRVLELKNKLGLFEAPDKDGSEADERALLQCPAHRDAARRAAAASFVLLKNDAAFWPLRREETVAFIGPYAAEDRLHGAWSVFADDHDCVSLAEGLRAAYPERRMTFAPGCPLLGPDVQISAYQPDPLPDPDAALAEALALAARADKVVLALGEPREFTGECASRTDIALPACQLDLYRRVREVNPNVGVVVFGGRPLDLREIDAGAQAVLAAWLPGTEGGAALARVLCGDDAPTGKLPMCFPRGVGQVPMSYDHLRTGRPLTHSYLDARFCSQYIDAPNESLYPFGHGLTYTTFAISPVTLDRADMTAGGVITAAVRVTNTGSRPGTETVQLYLRDLVGSVARPVRSLKGFRKVTLPPGESADVAFTIREDMLRFWNIDMDYVSEPGAFEVYIGADSTTDNKAQFTLVK